MERLPMALTNNRARRLIVAGAFAVAAAAAPAVIATAAAPAANAAPQCLAWFGNKEDGKCLSYSNGQPIYAGTPDFGVYGPNAGRNPGGGIGISTSPLLPGTTISEGVGVP
jgi:hypothetical protein